MDDKPHRVSHKKLTTTADNLSERDRNILWTIHRFRYLTTGQILRLYFCDATTDTAALRAANRCLLKLKTHGLIATLARRIGGARSGSSAFIWNLTAAGLRLLHLTVTGDIANGDKSTYMSDNALPVRKRIIEPTRGFLNHTLSVAEIYVQVTSVCRKYSLELLRAEPEPHCWRVYEDRSGKSVTLKPDLFILTATAEYEDSYFFESDLATEAPSRLIEKCHRYTDCHRSAMARKSTQAEVFPYVVFLVPDRKRQDSIRRRISEECSQTMELFLVIVPSEVETLIAQGAERLKCKEGDTFGKESTK
jgi:hypothetical protein